MILALDIGGTNIRSAIVNKTKIKEYKRSPTPKTKPQILKTIIKTIKDYKKPKALCVSTAGFEHNGIIINALNMDFSNVHLKNILKQKFKVPVFIENDANCATLAEAKFGAGKKFQNFILLTLGSGIGGGAILNKKLYRGRGGAIEPGSMIIQDEKIFESLASGNASAFLAKKMFKRNITSLELEKLADKGNKQAKAVYNEIGKYLGIGISNLAYIFDPEAILLGGGFTRVKHIHTPTQSSFNKHYKLPKKPKLLKAKFGDNAGLIGAALLPKLP